MASRTKEDVAVEVLGNKNGKLTLKSQYLFRTVRAEACREFIRRTLLVKEVTRITVNPNTPKSAPRIQKVLGIASIIQLCLTFAFNSVEISNNLGNFARLSSRNTICAVSVAAEDAPRSEIETSARFSAMESLIPSPTNATRLPSRCRRLT